MAVAADKGLCEPETVGALWSTCEGWAAGFTLMLERAAVGAAGLSAFVPASLETLFDYFTGQVFGALPADARRDLALCSYLPRVSGAQAAVLTGSPDAGEVLERLHRRHLFTHRRPGENAEYEFHALFRAFLRMQAQHLLTEVERARALHAAAGLLLRTEQCTEALALYCEAGDWDAAAGVIGKRLAKSSLCACAFLG